MRIKLTHPKKKYSHSLPYIVFISFFVFSSLSYAQSSVLSSGDIFKLEIPEMGIYKIDGNYISTNFGVELSSINPSNIQIFSDQGGPLTEKLVDFVSDPLEIPIFLDGAEDGRMDPNDAIYFFAYGADGIDISSDNIRLKKNIYSNSNYVFIKINGNEGLRINDKSSSISNAEFNYETTYKLYRHEEDFQNLLGQFVSAQGSGQEWYGESFANNWIQSFSDKFSEVDPLPGSQSTVVMKFAARSGQSSTVEIQLDNESYEANIRSSELGDIEEEYAHTATIVENLSLGASPDIQVNYNQNSNTDEAWLDFIQITTEEEIKYGIDQYIFHPESADFSSARLQLNESANNWQIWDVTNINNVSSLDLDSGLGYGYNVQNEVKLFTFFNATNIGKTPIFSGKIEVQNVKDLSNPEFIIVYHNDFLEAAMRLQEHRQTIDALTTSIVDVEKIYNEFSSGRKDVTAIRNFARLQLEINSDFQYMLLMGDASYDNRGIRSELPQDDFIPVYQTKESLDPVDGFPTDDYFAVLGMDVDSILIGQMDIAIGRFPVKTLEEANIVVDKVIRYETDPSSDGDWKLDIGFAADDEDNNLHIDDTDEIAQMTETQFPLFNQGKVYFDSFEQESTPGGPRYPDASKKLTENILKGQLVLTYLGHGGPKGWAQERVLQVEDISAWDNTYKLPLIVTATCSFTGFDDPNLITAGEGALLNPNGGAIALFTTVRAVFASRNAALTESTLDVLFRRKEGKYLRLGDVLRTGKNSISSSAILFNSRKFFLIGDPTLRLSAPKENVVLTHINDNLIDSIRTDTIKALDLVKLKGDIRNDDGLVLNNFSGKVFIRLFDKANQVSTLSNDAGSRVRSFELQNNILFKGSATVINGAWEIEFIVPKEINFQFGEGRISMYANDPNSIDAGGQFSDIVVGGSGENEIDDDIGPTIEIFMNDESFVSGGITTPSPNLLVNLEDALGINISSNNIGHDIIAIIDNEENNPIKLNDFYEATTDDFRSGTVVYPLRNIEPGEHIIRVKAWDIFNNSSERELRFIVVDGENAGIQNVLNYPNPFSTSTEFSFEHTFPGLTLDVIISIYTLSGKLVKTIESTVFSGGFRVNDILWDGRDDFGSKLAIGTYLYKVRVNNSDSNIELESDFQKLVKIN